MLKAAHILLGTAAFIAAPQAYAQTATPASGETRLEDIVVTAQKRTENLQNVPLAVTAVTANSLANRNISAAVDLPAVIPSLTYTTQAGGAAVPRIRGVGAVISFGGNENPVATYVDGVYFQSSASSILSLNNIEQVAVIKGPQGTLFGRNATGGVIQITTRDPKEEFSGQASATYGNLDTIGADLYLTGGIAPGLAADVAVYYLNQREGFGKNLTTGSDVNKARDFAIRSKWKLQIGEDTAATLALDYADTSTAAPANRPYYGTLPVGGPPFTGGAFDIYANVDPLFTNEQAGASLNIDHEMGGLRLVSITAARKSKAFSRIDLDRTRSPLGVAFSNLKDRQFTQELQLLSDDAGRFRWVLGGYYFRARGGYLPGIFSTVASTANFYSSQQAESVAAFGQGTYDLTAATKITVGLRYTTETRKFNARSTLTSPSGIVTTPPRVTGKIDADKLTWRLALDHRLSEELLAYASYNRGFKSGGFNPTAFAPPTQTVRPEIVDAYEVGLKADFLDHAVRVNAAAFYYDYKDIQLTAFSSGLQRTFNATSSTIYGLDVDVTATPLPRLVLTAGLSLIHARFGDFPTAIISRPNAPAPGNTLVAGDASDNRLPQTPDWTLNIGGEYEIPLPAGNLRLSANFFHSDGWRAESDNRLRQEPYDLVNGSVTWEFGEDGAYSIKLYGKNLTDAQYASQVSAQPGVDSLFLAPGRTYGVTVGARF